MDTIFRARRALDARSGGKILRGRRVAVAASPYARPKSPPPRSENPNWLVGLISPATRMVLNGAGKLFSSVFNSESSPSSSSGSDSSSDDDDEDISSDAAEELNLKNGMASDTNKYLEKAPLPILWKSESKLAIEKLIMQEMFSRDECDRLTKIIQSRVVDCPTIKGGEDMRQNQLPGRTVGDSTAFPGAFQPHWQTINASTAYPYLVDGLNSFTPRASERERNMPDFFNTAVMEARKWLEERKSKSSSKSGLDDGTCTLNTVMNSHVAEGEGSSPVDMAKSYMRARPPWASPPLSHVGFQTPSPSRMHLFNEGTPYGIGGHSFSSSQLLKRNSLATGSWDLLEEIRRVRFKAEHIGGQIPSEAEKREIEMADTIHDSNSLPAAKSIDGPANLPADLKTSDGSTENLGHGKFLSAPLVSEKISDGLVNEALSSGQATLVSEINQDLEDTQLTKGEKGNSSVFDLSVVPHSISVQHNGSLDCSADIINSGTEVKSAEDMKPAVQGSGLPLIFPMGDVIQATNSSPPHLCSDTMGAHSIDDSRPQQEPNAHKNSVAANGFPSSIPSLPAELHADHPSLRSSDGGDPNLVSSSHGKLDTGSMETCELLSEASIDVPIIEGTENILTGPQNGSIMHYEELLRSQPLPNSSVSLSGKSSSKVEKQQGKKRGGYSRRGRGRGK